MKITNKKVRIRYNVLILKMYNMIFYCVAEGKKMQYVFCTTPESVEELPHRVPVCKPKMQRHNLGYVCKHYSTKNICNRGSVAYALLQWSYIDAGGEALYIAG